eukprot:scaffold117868_cov38-Prasinocladus_malaysianus.AAC.1
MAERRHGECHAGSMRHAIAATLQFPSFNWCVICWGGDSTGSMREGGLWWQFSTARVDLHVSALAQPIGVMSAKRTSDVM